MNVHTAYARSAAALVAVVAGAASWEHIASVAIDSGERDWVGYSLPLAIDGLILVGVSALLEDRRNGRVQRISARLAVVVGVLATLAANVASAEPTTKARLVAVAAPVCFLIAIEVLTRTGRKVSAADDTPTAWLAAASDDQLLDAWLAAHPDPATPEPTTEPDPVSAEPVKRSRSTRSPSKSRRDGGKRSAAAKVAAARKRHPTATQREVAKRIGVSVRSVARYWHASEAASEPNNHRHDGVPELVPVGGGET